MMDILCYENYSFITVNIVLHIRLPRFLLLFTITDVNGH